VLVLSVKLKLIYSQFTIIYNLSVTQAHGAILKRRGLIQVFILLQQATSTGTLYFDGQESRCSFVVGIQQLSQWDSYENGFAKRRKSL
jgi:hypothetical protein